MKSVYIMLQIFHFGTAQQDGNRIEFSAVCLDTKFDMTFDSEIWLSNTSVSPGLAYKFTIDLDSKRCTRTQIDRASVEFPSTHPYRHGMRGTRYNYFMACDRPGFNLPYRDVVKVRIKFSLKSRQNMLSLSVHKNRMALLRKILPTDMKRKPSLPPPTNQ